MEEMTDGLVFCNCRKLCSALSYANPRVFEQGWLAIQATKEVRTMGSLQRADNRASTLFKLALYFS